MCQFRYTLKPYAQWLNFKFCPPPPQHVGMGPWRPPLTRSPKCCVRMSTLIWLIYMQAALQGPQVPGGSMLYSANSKSCKADHFRVEKNVLRHCVLVPWVPKPSVSQGLQGR